MHCDPDQIQKRLHEEQLLRNNINQHKSYVDDVVVLGHDLCKHVDDKDKVQEMLLVIKTRYNTLSENNDENVSRLEAARPLADSFKDTYGELEQVLIRGSRGYVLMVQAGDSAVLTVLTKANARLGLIFLDAKRTAESIMRLL